LLIGAAVEGILKFNPENDAEKTNGMRLFPVIKLQKLNTMWLRNFLETTADGERLRQKF
jgi:hypothetical protein